MRCVTVHIKRDNESMLDKIKVLLNIGKALCSVRPYYTKRGNWKMVKENLPLYHQSKIKRRALRCVTVCTKKDHEELTIE